MNWKNKIPFIKPDENALVKSMKRKKIRIKNDNETATLSHLKNTKSLILQFNPVDIQAVKIIGSDTQFSSFYNIGNVLRFRSKDFGGSSISRHDIGR